MAIPEQTATVAYTRLVLDTGQSESLTTLYAALAPCTIGYGVIGQWLASHPDTVFEGNPYREWIARLITMRFISSLRWRAGSSWMGCFLRCGWRVLRGGGLLRFLGML